jgi:hypothetical protein
MLIITAQVACGAAEGGALEILEWIRNTLYSPLPLAVAPAAAFGGHVPLLRVLLDTWQLSCDKKVLAREGVRGGHVPMLEHLAERLGGVKELNPRGRGGQLSSALAEHGHLAALLWANRTHRSPMDVETAVAACRRGQLPVLQYLWETGVLTETLLEESFRRMLLQVFACGHVHVASWLVELQHKAPGRWFSSFNASDVQALVQAATNADRLEMLQWLYEQAAGREIFPPDYAWQLAEQNRLLILQWVYDSVAWFDAAHMLRHLDAQGLRVRSRCSEVLAWLQELQREQQPQEAQPLRPPISLPAEE